MLFYNIVYYWLYRFECNMKYRRHLACIYGLNPKNARKYVWPIIISKFILKNEIPVLFAIENTSVLCSEFIQCSEKVCSFFYPKKSEDYYVKK